MKKSLALLLALSFGATSALAQSYPAKQIKFVVGFPAGSSIDVVSRIVLDDIRERTGATIVIDNKAGALGAIGLGELVKADADGYTLMPSSSATHSSGPYLSKALQKLDPQNSTAHVARLVQFNVAVVTHTAGRHKNAQSLIAAGKAKPDSLVYGYGSGTGQVGAAAFGKATGIQARPIPYKGQPPALTDLIGGQIDFVAADVGVLLPFLKAGTLTAITVLSDKRSTLLPDVPTAAELGYPGAVLVGWIGIDGPAKLPAEVTHWWSEQIKLTLATPKVQEKLSTIGMEPAPLAGDAFVKFVETQNGVWGKHVRAAGIQAE